MTYSGAQECPVLPSFLLGISFPLSLCNNTTISWAAHDFHSCLHITFQEVVKFHAEQLREILDYKLLEGRLLKSNDNLTKSKDRPQSLTKGAFLLYEFIQIKIRGEYLKLVLLKQC